MGGAATHPPDQYRDYILAVTFGYTPQEIDDSPANRLDWLMACHSTVEKYKADQQREAERHG